MTEIQVGDIAGNFKHLDSTPPEGVKPPTSVMTLEVTVENKPEPLRTIKPYVQSQAAIPSTLPPEASIVLHLLFECFAKADEVKEGLIKNIILGFADCGVAQALTYNGLAQLAQHGYIKFQAPDNAYVDIAADAIGKTFVRYQPKLLELVYDGQA